MAYRQLQHISNHHGQAGVKFTCLVFAQNWGAPALDTGPIMYSLLGS